MATHAPADVPPIIVADPAPVNRRIDDFIAGRSALSGLELYYELERVTPILGFHTMLHDGERNRAHSGLQQSYGDHNRLLMLGLDKLLEGDLEWYSTRIAPDAVVGDESLRECVTAAARLDPPRAIQVALWLGAALHDCGMLCGRGAYVDVEDGIVLSRDVIDVLCLAPHRALALAVLHHHDYIKGVFNGEVPAATVADEIDTLDPALRPVALAGLGLVQVAGAASLGEGRLEAFRIGIFKRCLAGDALDDRTTLTRLARLLDAEQDAGPRSTDDAASLLAQLDDPARASVDALLTTASVHAWQRAMGPADALERLSLLVQIADRRAVATADDVLLEVTPTAARPLDVGRASSRMDTALSGRSLLVIEW